MPSAVPLRESGAVFEMSEGRNASSMEKPAKNKPKPSAAKLILEGVIHNKNSAIINVQMLAKKNGFNLRFLSAMPMQNSVIIKAQSNAGK